jgi:hypothetical protein
MKTAILSLLILILIVAVIWRLSEPKHVKVSHSSAPVVPVTTAKPVQAALPFGKTFTSDDLRRFRSAREAALSQNPDLAAEYKEIISEIENQQQKLDAAMIKADPAVAPIIVKLKIIRKSNSIPQQ